MNTLHTAYFMLIFQPKTENPMGTWELFLEKAEYIHTVREIGLCELCFWRFLVLKSTYLKIKLYA